MPKKQAIPMEIQEEVQKSIDEFNRGSLKEVSSLWNTFFPRMKYHRPPLATRHGFDVP